MHVGDSRQRRWHALAPVLVLGVFLALALAACTTHYDYGSVSFTDQQNGWVTGWNATTERSVVSRTTDGGATWTAAGSRKVRAQIVGWVEFLSPTTGVWCCDANKILYTTTGGATWTRATVARFSGYFTDAAFSTASDGWACGVSDKSWKPGVVARTADGGQTWTVRLRTGPKASPGGFTSVVVLDAETCLALKSGVRDGVYATSDGGSTWTRHVLPGAKRRAGYRSLAFPTPLVGYAVGTRGRIAKTVDGGANWTAQTSGVTTMLHDVTFRTADRGFAAGAAGVILATTDGGAVWAPVPSGTTDDLRSIDFVTDGEGWVVGKTGWAPGQSGVLLHTTDGGASWH